MEKVWFGNGGLSLRGYIFHWKEFAVTNSMRQFLHKTSESIRGGIDNRMYRRKFIHVNKDKYKNIEHDLCNNIFEQMIVKVAT